MTNPILVPLGVSKVNLVPLGVLRVNLVPLGIGFVPLVSRNSTRSRWLPYICPERMFNSVIETLPPLPSVVALGVALSSRPVVIGCLFLPLTLLVILACWFLFGISTAISLLSADFCITPADHAIVGVIVDSGAVSGFLGLP